MSNSLPQVRAVSKIKMEKKVLSHYLSPLQAAFHLTLFNGVQKVLSSPLFILFYYFLAFSYNFTSCLPYNPSPSASVLNVKILQWLKRKPRICCKPIAQSTAFSIPVINLFVFLFSLRKKPLR